LTVPQPRYGAAAHPNMTCTVFTMSTDDRSDRPQGERRPVGPLAGMGAAWLMIGAVVLGVGIGLGADRLCNTSPWATLISSMVFLAAGVYLVIREGSR
jgi:F0F1-type ATP synthase assembly protein I